MVRAIRSFPVLLAGVMAAVFLTRLADAASPAVTLIDPQWQQQRDSQGLFWMIDPQSNLRVNGQSMLSVVSPAMINNVQFMPSRVQMRPDGTEYVFEAGNFNNNPYGGVAQTLLTVRRIKMDLQTSTVRFVESFRNTGPAPLQVSMTAGSSMRSFVQSVVCGPSGTTLSASTGQPMTSQPAGGAVLLGGRTRRTGPLSAPGGTMVRLAIPEHDCGVVVRSPINGFPVVLFYAPESANVKPSIDVQTTQVQVSYTVTVPAQSTASVVWGLAQRTVPASFDSAEMKNQLKVFQDREWLSDLPENVTKTIVNYKRFNSGGEQAIAPLLQPVLDLATHYRLERGKADVLVQDDQTQLPGIVAGSDLSIETPLGKTSVPLGEVALLCGSAGADRPMRVYLRNGEILVGRVEAKDLVLKAQAGVEAKLPPEKIHLLFLHAARDDGKAPAKAESIIETHDGQRLLLSDSNAQFHAATPWGRLDVALGEIDRLTAHREPQPVYRLTLKDGSNLCVLLQDELPPVNTLRFGPVKLSAAGVRQLWSLKTPPAAKGPDEEQSAGPAGPHCRLIGENLLAGMIDSPKVNFATAGGVLVVPVSGIQTAQRSGDPQADGPIDIELTDGRHLTGQLAKRTVAIRFHGKVWEVPAQHLIGISGGKKAAAAESSPPNTSAADVANAAGSAKAGGKEEDVPRSELPSATPASIPPKQPATSAPSPVQSGKPSPAASSTAPPQVAPGKPAPPMLPTTAPVAPIVPASDDDDPFQ
ncbi:MAG: hypothetical protein ACLP9L_10100 [Thermoguttaceae bacterium]